MHILQEDLNSLQKWAHSWQMNFHPQKCKVLKINKGAEFSYKMVDKGEDVMLDEVKTEKDLGVQIDSELSFNEQCSSAINRARKIAIIIWRTFVSIDESMIKPLYTALIRSRLEYGIEVWSPRFKKESKAIESVQRMVTRMVPSLKELEYGDRLRKLKLPSLKYRRIRGDMIQVYKYMNEKYHNKALFEISSEERTRGHRLKLFKPRCRTNIQQIFSQ